eukprot:COSAG01_NODE_1956_length_8813_cov_9.237434_3_plen_213_part_00
MLATAGPRLWTPRPPASHSPRACLAQAAATATRLPTRLGRPSRLSVQSRVDSNSLVQWLWHAVAPPLSSQAAFPPTPIMTASQTMLNAHRLAFPERYRESATPMLTRASTLTGTAFRITMTLTATMTVSQIVSNAHLNHASTLTGTAFQITSIHFPDAVTTSTQQHVRLAPRSRVTLPLCPTVSMESRVLRATAVVIQTVAWMALGSRCSVV